MTLYASANDRAIRLSEGFHEFWRVGDSKHICVVPKVDTIDASAVDTSLIGHSYFGDNTSILGDMVRTIETGSLPGERVGMHALTLEQLTYWALRL